MKEYAVTGTYHGAHIQAKCEGDARRIFHRRYNGESIISIHIIGQLKTDFII
jgi:hypothetical protein